MLKAKIPATIITGFLGSGKTTLIQHALRQAEGRRFALIINEFGEQGVDGELLRACGLETCAEDGIVELANGCLCCTVAEDFLPTMRALLDRAAPPEHIIIETSGLALPKPLVEAFNWPDVKNRATVDAVVAVIDAAAVVNGRFDDVALEGAQPAAEHDNPLHELFEEQVVCADLIVLNKRDLLDAAQLDAAKTAVAHHARPGTAILGAENGAVPLDVLLGIAVRAEDDLASRPSHHDDEEGHDHDDFASVIIDVEPVSDVSAFVERLRLAIRRQDVLRVKGHMAVSGKPLPLLLQAVGERIETYFAKTAAPVGRLIVIGHHDLDGQAFTQALQHSEDAAPA